MSKKANTTAIGLFVIGAVLLTMAGIVIFGSGKFFVKKYTYVAYFSGSVKGLNVGAPVLWNGVKVGEVTKILMEFDAKEVAMRIPVVFQMSRGNSNIVNREYYEGINKVAQDEILIDLVNRGLRAQLAPQSFITGLLYVKLEFFPESEIALVGEESLGSDLELTEIPTIPSDMEELARTFENLPLKQIAQNLEDITAGIQKLVSSPHIAAILTSVEGATAALDQTITSLDKQLASLATDLKTVIRNTNRLVSNLSRQVDPVAQGLIDTTDAATGAFNQAEAVLSFTQGPAAEVVADIQQALEQANTTMQAIETLAGEDSETIYTMNTALEEIAMAARSIRVVAEYLERHPESLLRGKGGK